MSLGNWHGVSPNTAHQEWSHWTFKVKEAGRHIPRADVELNAMRWLRMGFGSVGEARITQTPTGWKIEARIEGESAADPNYVRSVRHAFREFVRKGWGLGAVATMGVKILAGDVPSGARAQLIVMPTIIPNDKPLT